MSLTRILSNGATFWITKLNSIWYVTCYFSDNSKFGQVLFVLYRNKRCSPPWRATFSILSKVSTKLYWVFFRVLTRPPWLKLFYGYYVLGIKFFKLFVNIKYPCKITLVKNWDYSSVLIKKRPEKFLVKTRTKNEKSKFFLIVENRALTPWNT